MKSFFIASLISLLSLNSLAGEIVGYDFSSVGVVGAGPSDLHGFRIPAGTLANNGETLFVTAWGFTMGAGGKCNRLWFEGNTDVSWCVSTQAAWLWEIRITRTALNKYQIVSKLSNGEMLENTGVYGTGVALDIPGGKNWRDDDIIFKFVGDSADPNINDAVSMNYSEVELRKR